MKKNSLKTITVTALMSACCFIAFRYIKISYPFTIHLGNVFCILAALLFGGVQGGICGAIGMGIGDLLDPRYVMTFPKTLVCKMAMAITTGLFAHRIFKVNETNSKTKLFVSILFGVLANIIFEIIFGFIYYKYIIQTIEGTFIAFFVSKIVSVSVTSIITLFVSFFLYFPIYNRIKNLL